MSGKCGDFVTQNYRDSMSQPAVICRNSNAETESSGIFTLWEKRTGFEKSQKADNSIYVCLHYVICSMTAMKIKVEMLNDIIYLKIKVIFRKGERTYEKKYRTNN